MRRTFLLGPLTALVLVMALLVGPATADPASTAAVASVWIKSQQQSDGGFEVAGFPGFETPDAVLALAEAAQTDTIWNAGAAHDEVSAVAFGGSGPTPLDALDDLAESTPTAGSAAKLIVLNALPLGIDPTDFDPSGDSPAPVNLVAALDAGCGADTASFGFFGATLFAVIAKRLVCGTAPPAAVATIRSAQQANGGWDFSGDPSGDGVDVDTTSLAIQALVAAGADSSDAAVRRALGLLAREINPNGSWNSPFVTGDPNSTAMGTLGVIASGFDPGESCWRDLFATGRAGVRYTGPREWLESQQALDGHIASPNDVWGVNTFATSQSVQALLARWLPVLRAPVTGCPVATTYLAEGSTGPGLETWILAVNPSETETVTARATFITGSGWGGAAAVAIPPLARRSIRANDYVTDWDVSTVVEGLDGRVVAERAVYSSISGRKGAHLGKASDAPAPNWFLAEGSTGPGFETWVLVANPDPTLTANATVSFMTGSGPGPELTFSLGPETRRSIRANDFVTDWDVSTRVVATGPGVVAERATYVSGGRLNGATDAPGVTAPAPSWFLAEGSTGPGFETWVLVANPDPTLTANATVSFMTGSGPGPELTFSLGPETRRSIRANDYMTDWDVSTRVRATGPGVVAERTVYVPASLSGDATAGPGVAI